MTEQRRLTIRAELARRMGWQVFPYLLNVGLDGKMQTLYCPPGASLHVSNAVNLPNPFTSAAANRELVEWLAADDDRWFLFIRREGAEHSR